MESIKGNGKSFLEKSVLVSRLLKIEKNLENN